jgi:formiminotetrahydrofolate cyclodeaminase
MDGQLTPFLHVLDSGENQPRGGAAAALAGAMAASLMATVARATVNYRYASQPHTFYYRVEQQARALAETLLAHASEELEAVGRVIKARHLPQGTDTEKVAHHQAIQAAMIGATRLWLTIGQNCVQVLDLIDAVTREAEPDFGTDVACACYLATAGLRSAIDCGKIYIDDIEADDVAIELGQMVQSLIGEIPDPYTWVRDRH